jgi:hypothetical protein
MPDKVRESKSISSVAKGGLSQTATNNRKQKSEQQRDGDNEAPSLQSSGVFRGEIKVPAPAVVDVALKPGLKAETLASFGWLFRKRFSALKTGSMDDAEEALRAASELISDRGALFEYKYETLQDHLARWLTSIGGFAQKQVCALAQITDKDRDAARWARVEVENLLATSLGPEILPSWTKARTLIELSAVEHWSRWVCEGGYFDLSNTGAAKPWGAPVWYESFFNTPSWITEGRQHRLTVEQTEHTVGVYQTLFWHQLQNDLNEAEHQARLELASPDPPATPAPEAHDRVFSLAAQQTSLPAIEATIARKLRDPKEFPTMTHAEARQALSASEKKIARLLDEGKLTRCGPNRYSRLIATDSVKSFVVSTPED